MNKLDPLDIVGYAIIVLCVILVSSGLYAIYRAAAASGQVEYCYVESISSGGMTVVHLHGHRPWRFDRFIGGFTTMKAAAAAASKIDCPIR